MVKHRQIIKVFYFIAIFIIIFDLKYNTSVDFAFAEPQKPSYCLMEASSGRVLKESYSDRRMEMASTTKILTALLVLRNVDLSDVVVIPDIAEDVEGSSIYLRGGERWTVEDLLYGLMLRSGNDAAVALAIHVGGDVDGFVNMMNEYCVAKGLKNSHFDNPHGLHSDTHYTSAYDLALITADAMSDARFVRIVSTTHHSYSVDGEYRGDFVNKNKLLTRYDGANGVKTGYTISAGRCYVGSAVRDGMQLIAVTLNIYDTYGTAAALLDYGFDNYVLVDIARGFSLTAVMYDASEVSVVCVDSCLYPVREDDDLRYELVDIGLDWAQVDEKGLYITQCPPAGTAVAMLRIYDGERLIFEGDMCTM